MANKTLLKERTTNETLYPVTSIDCVIGADVINERLDKIEKRLDETDENVHLNDFVQFVIDQRYSNSLSDPGEMVTKNFIILDKQGNKVDISSSGSTGDAKYNCLTWLRENSHAYVCRNVNGKLRLKQLDDTTRKKFADGTSSLDYIGNENGEYDVMMKINSDVYWKTEPWIASAPFRPTDTKDDDFVLVTIARKIPEGEDESKWQKWSKYNLVGVYKACKINNKLHSLSGKRPVNSISQTNAKAYARARGKGFKLIDYKFHTLLAYLLYGWYSNLDSQAMCGFGTTNYVEETKTYYPKITGQTDDLAGVDTDSATGTGASAPDVEQIKAGEGADIKSNNFWHIENFQGDIYEWVDDMRVMQAKRPSDKTTSNPNIYLNDYIDGFGYPVVTNQGHDYQLTAEAFEAMDEGQRFIAITDIDGKIVRIIQHGNNIANSEGWIKQMCFGDHADLIPKTFGASGTTGFCDYGGVYSAGCVAIRSYISAHSGGGVGCLSLYDSAGRAVSYIGSRLLYEGDENTVYIIDDATETL